MIVWSGRGFLIVIVLIATLFTVLGLLPKEYGDYAFVIAAYVAGIFSFVFGTKWNNKKARVLIDEKTGERILVKNNHSLFWIPMQYWGFIFAFLGTFILTQNSILFGTIIAAILLGVVIIFILKQKQGVGNTFSDGQDQEFNLPKQEPLSNFNSKETTSEPNYLLRPEKEEPSRFMPK